MNRAVLIVGILVVTPLLIFLALSFRSDPRLIESPLIGRPAPDFNLADLDGNVVRLADLKGKPVLLNFWATWCQPCIAEHPVLQAGARFYEGQASFIGIIYQDKPELIRRFVETRGAWGPSLVDPDVGVAIAYGVYGAPETFIIDADGIVVEKLTGPVDAATLRGIMDSLL